MAYQLQNFSYYDDVKDGVLSSKGHLLIVKRMIHNNNFSIILCNCDLSVHIKMLCVTLTLKVKVTITLNGTANPCLYACFIMHIFKIIAEYIIFIVLLKVIHSQGSYEQMKGCIQVPIC